MMQKDFNEYGEKSFVFEVVEEEKRVDKSIKRNPTREQAWMIKLKTYDEKHGYNCNDPFFMHRGKKPTGILLLLSSKPSVDKVAKVAKYLGVTVEELIED